MKVYMWGLVVVVFIMSGCATKNDNLIQSRVLSPESVSIYDIPVNNIFAEANNGRKLLHGFPFISNRPIIDLKGKFSNQFYDKLDYSYKYAALQNVNFWQLRTNPLAEDFIYVLPIWADQFKRVSNNLFENIGYSYNLSSKEQEILKWWIGQGGILWIEGGIYSTRYDTFKKNGEINQKAIKQKLIQKSRNLSFFDTAVHTTIYKSKQVDFINYVPMRIHFKTISDLAYFQDIKNLEVKTDNYLQVDFMPQGRYLLKSQSGRPLVSFLRYGKGGVVFLYPFEFQNSMYDGELLRWKLLYFLLEKMYLKQDTATKNNVQVLKEPYDTNVTSKNIINGLDNNKKVVLNNLEFTFNSYHLKPSSLTPLRSIADYLVEHKTIRLQIDGYTDNVGSQQYNKILSLRRAQTVKAALIKMGIEANRIQTSGYGKLYPIVTNNTEYGRSQNRRVEFIIIKR